MIEKVNPQHPDKMAHQQYSPNIARLKRRHNRIKRRIDLGMGKPNDVTKLQDIKRRLGYVRS